MSELDKVVSVSITRHSQSITTASFQIPLVLVEEAPFSDEAITRQYTSLSAVEEDFLPGSIGHTFASRLFGQEVSPPKIIIGTRDEEEAWDVALSKVETDNSEWYGLVSEAREADDQFALATAVQGLGKIYGVSTSDPDAVDPEVLSDIGSRLEAAGLDRTFVIYTASETEEYPEAAWMGDQMPRTPGSNDWCFKRVTGVSPSKLSDTQIANLREKGYNFYTTLGGVSIFQDGNMADGTPIDEVVFIDWLKARIQEGVYFRLINTLKVPLTRAGFTIIENEIRSVLAQGVANNGLADNPAPTVTSPDPLAVPATQRAQRIGGTFTFTGRLAGSMRKVLIDGTLTV